MPLDDDAGERRDPVILHPRARRVRHWSLSLGRGRRAVTRSTDAISPSMHAAWDLRRFGVEPRHLRMYETAAEREAALFQQILMPAVRHRTPETRQKLVETLGELQQLTADLKAVCCGRALRQAFDDDLG